MIYVRLPSQSCLQFVFARFGAASWMRRSSVYFINHVRCFVLCIRQRPGSVFNRYEHEEVVKLFLLFVLLNPFANCDAFVTRAARRLSVLGAPVCDRVPPQRGRRGRRRPGYAPPPPRVPRFFSLCLLFYEFLSPRFQIPCCLIPGIIYYPPV